MNSHKPIAIIKAGHTYQPIRQHYGDFDDWVARGLGLSTPVIRIDATSQSALPAPESLAGVVITGSHAMVTEGQPWMRRLAHWLFSAIEGGSSLPVLGLCFGHQLLAQMLGGEVADNPSGLEVGTVALRLTPAGYQDALLGAMADHPWAQVVHKQSVLTPPPGSTLLASNVHDGYQAFRYGERVWGVQFHPEFSADVMRAYLQALRGEDLSQQQVDTHLQDVHECREASGILARFAQLTVAQVA